MSDKLSPVTNAARRRLSRIGFSFFLFFLAAYVTQIPLGAWISAYHPGWLEAPITVWLLSVVTMYCVAFPLFYLCLRPLPVGEHGNRPMRIRDLCVLFFISFAAMYVTNLVGNAINLVTDAIFGSSSSAEATELILESPLYLTVIFAVVIGPIVEEAMFRGILLPRLLPFGEGFAILTSALLFGLFHTNFEQFFYAFSIGLIFGVVMSKTGRLRYTVFLHMALNFFGTIPSAIIMRQSERLGLTEMDEAAILESPEAILTLLFSSGYSLLLFAFVIIGLFFLGKHLKAMRPRPAEAPIPKDERRYLPVSVGGILYLLTLLVLFAQSYR